MKFWVLTIAGTSTFNSPSPLNLINFENKTGSKFMTLICSKKVTHTQIHIQFIWWECKQSRWKGCFPHHNPSTVESSNSAHFCCRDLPKTSTCNSSNLLKNQSQSASSHDCWSPAWTLFIPNWDQFDFNIFLSTWIGGALCWKEVMSNLSHTVFKKKWWRSDEPTAGS